MAFVTSSFFSHIISGTHPFGYHHGHEVNICILFVLVDISLSYKKRGAESKVLTTFILLYF